MSAEGFVVVSGLPVSEKTLRAWNKEATRQPEELLAATEGVSSGMTVRVFGASSGLSSAPAKKELRRLCFLKELHSGSFSEREKETEGIY